MIVETFGELLRGWRHHRRLSQLDLAIAADVSARHVSLVETGKSNPSPAMVLRLAEHLDVPLRERNRLLLAAGFAPRYPERPLGGDALPAARDAVARVLSAHEPYPALVFDRRWNILMTNRAIEPFFATVHPDLLRPPAPDPELTALYEELLAPDDPSGTSIDADVVIPMIIRIGGREVRLFSTITTFGTPMDITLDEIAIESYYPADAESAAYFAPPDAVAR